MNSPVIDAEQVESRRVLGLGMRFSAAPLMPTVPTRPGWRWHVLTKLARLATGHTPSRRESAWWGGDIQWLQLPDIRAVDGRRVFNTSEQINPLGIENSSSVLLPAGTVCMSRTASVGFVTIMGREMATSQDFVNWVCGPDLDPDFLMFLLMASRKPIRDLGSGATHQSIYFQTVESFCVCVPPITEQRAIVAELSRRVAGAELARAAARSRFAAAEALPAAYLREVFEGPKASEWEVVAVRDFADASGGLQKQPKRSAHTFHRPYLTVRNVQRGSLDLSHVERFEITPTELERLRLERGDILIVEGNGSPDQIGRNAIFDLEGEEWIHQNHVIRVRLSERADHHFVSKYLNSDAGRRQMLERAQSTSGLYTLSVEKVNSLEVPLPTLAEQQRVAADLSRRIAGADRLAADIRAELATIEALPAALLRDAFAAPAANSEVVETAAEVLPVRPAQPSNFFHRGAIGSYIINRLHGNITFGRVHFEKNLYLTEAFVGIDMAGRYKRQAAGPLDADFLYKLESLAAKHHWFTKHKRGAEGFFYRPGDAIGDRLTAAEATLGERRPLMDKLLDLTAKLDTERVEIVATLFAAWNDRIIDGAPVTDPLIVEDVRERWHEAKMRFPPDRLAGALGWMRKHDFVPTGIGPHTVIE